MALLDVEDLHVRYGAIVALRGMSLSVNEGEIVGLIGVNGAGKSTTMKAIMQVVRPDRGKITYEGQSLIGMTPENVVRRGIAPVMEGRRIFPALTIEENLRLGAAIRSDRDGIKADIDKWCQFFPILGERLAKPAGTLSGGQQQMLAVARGLMSRPKLVLMDEPSLGLSPKLVAEVFGLIAELRGLGVTILLIEQNVRMTLNIVDRAYLVNTGRVEFVGTPDEIRQHADLEQAYLGGGRPAASVGTAASG
ncbi:MAG: ABC transporter ATP-binding protein [Thermomicrobiales bacterium]|jgi:branched-chain amino acid transport system ATP-binding protein